MKNNEKTSKSGSGASSGPEPLRSLSQAPLGPLWEPDLGLQSPRFSSSGGSFSRFSGLRLENHDFRAPEAHFRWFRGSGSKITIFELRRLIFDGFGVQARKSRFWTSRGSFSMVSGLRLEFQDFRAPETHFRGFRGSGSNIKIFELHRLIFEGFGPLAPKSRFSNSRSPFSRVSGSGSNLTISNSFSMFSSLRRRFLLACDR